MILFRTFVSRKAAGKVRAILEGLGLDLPQIDSLISGHRSDEEAVQAGLLKWRDGSSRTTPTWKVLLSAMEHARLPQQDVQSLKQKLGPLEKL